MQESTITGFTIVAGPALVFEYLGGGIVAWERRGSDDSNFPGPGAYGYALKVIETIRMFVVVLGTF